MPRLVQETLPLFESVSLSDHIQSHLTDVGFRETKKLGDPTTHEPGTWSKVEVLAYRVAMGEPLWHPNDAKAKPKRFGWESGEVGL